MKLPGFLDPVEWVLLGFIAAFGLSYGGMRLLWAGVGASGMTRGLVLAAPAAALAITFAAIGQPGMGVALCMAAAVLMLTLGTGVAAVGRADYDYTIDRTTPPTLRLIAPLAACACAIGFHGDLTLTHLVALAVIGGLTIWSAWPGMTAGGQWAFKKIAVASGVMALAVVLIVFAATLFQSAAGAMVVTPLVVLLASPALLLPLMGLLSSESRAGHFASAGDTVSGFIMATLGFAMPLTIAVGMIRNAGIGYFHIATFAQTNVMMPVATWRIDSLLLLVTSVILMPGVTGKMRLGRVEGIFLVGLYLAYAAIASRSGLAG